MTVFTNIRKAEQPVLKTLCKNRNFNNKAFFGNPFNVFINKEHYKEMYLKWVELADTGVYGEK